MSDDQIDYQIDKTHLKSTKQILPHVQKALPSANITKEKVKAVNKTRPKDKHPHSKKRYYYPVFSNHRYGFMMDLLEQSRDRDPKIYPAYFMILININTKYAYAIPLENKNQNTINDALQDFIKDHKIVSIVCDNEGAFTSNLVLKTLTDNKISIKIITEQRHTALSVIDRFIRTLRDMNTPTVKSSRQSDDPKYRDFSRKRMDKLLNIYNNTVHTSTDHTPTEMESDPSLEQKYIIKKIYETERRRKVKDFELQEGMYVRYILPKDPNKKHRYKVSPEAYIISHKDGNSYVIMAEDGTTKTVSRWRLFPLGKTLPKKHKFAKTFGNNMGTVDKIISYNSSTKKYRVSFVLPDGSSYEDEIRETNLRGSNPQIMSALEKAYRKKND